MKKNFYNRCKITVFCLLAMALVSISATVFAAENEAAGKAGLFTISYNESGANGAAPTDAKAYNAGEAAVVMGEGELTKTERTFAGWSKTPNGTTADYLPGDEIKVEQNITLYAVWSCEQSEPAVIISNSGKVSHTKVGASGANFFPDRSFVAGN